MRTLLFANGFVYNHETKDFTKSLTDNVTIRAEVWKDRIKVFLQFDKIENVVEYWDIVYMNSYTRVSFLKLLAALYKLAHLEPKKSKIKEKSNR